MNQRSSSSPSGDRMGAAASSVERSSVERAAKRRRQNSPDNDDKNTTTAIKQQTLPPEVWADVMEFLPLDMVLTCGAVSRSFLYDTMPLITRIRIDKAYQMHRATARRFKDVTDIHINSLILEDLFEEGTIDEIRDIDVGRESKIRFVPFLSCFSALERVYFGGKNHEGEYVDVLSTADGYFMEEGDVDYEAPRDAMKSSIDMISAGFDTGALPKNCLVFGLSCPDAKRSRRNDQCKTCLRACRSFPLESVLAFESKGSSVSIARSGRMHGLDVCLQTTKVESIIESRTGGKELLCSDIRFLRLLRSGRCWKLESVDGTKSELRIVKYTSDQLDEMKRVIEYADLDVKKLSAQNVETAILNSFINGRTTAQNCKLYLSEKALLCLRDEIGIEVDTMKLFDCNAGSMIKWAKPITQHLADYLDDELPFRDENSAILPDYIKLIRQFLELESGAPIQQLARAIPTLAILLNMKQSEYCYTPTVEDKIEAVKSLNLFLTKGKKMQKTMVVDAGAAFEFCRLLEGVNGDKSIVKDAIIGLANIVDHDRDLMNTVMDEDGTMQKLISLLESSDNICVKSSLQLLAIASSNDHYVQTLLDCGLVSHLCRMVLSMEHYMDCLPIFSVLLRNVTESDKFPIEAIDSIFIEKVSMLLEASTDETVETNLSLVCVMLGLAANEGNIDRLVTGTDMLPTLVRLQSSQVGTVSDKAIDCLERISNIKSSFEVEDESKEKLGLAWGEFRMLEIVDSDEESATEYEDIEYEEALEVSDEQVALELQQAFDANARIIFYNPPCGDYDEREASPNLLGIPYRLLQNILIFATETQVEVNVLATVCKKFRWILDDDDNDFRKRHGWPNKREVVLRYVRRFQKHTTNEIMEVIASANDGEGEYDVKKLHAFVSNLVAKMNHIGPVVSFRLRSDAMLVLFEMCQEYMIRRLQDAALFAFQSHGTEVQKQDFFLLPSQAARSVCDIFENIHGSENFSCECTCALPSSSGIIWRWPNNNCGDVLTSYEGRRIIRRLAYRAGIVQMTGQAFEIAQAELLHTLGVLIVEAYETCVESSKHTRHLAPEEDLPYGLFPDAMDMFYVSPPPKFLHEEGAERDSENKRIEYAVAFTIVPGQIYKAATKRNIGINKVYGNWFATNEADFDFEKSLYFKDGSDSDCDSFSTTSSCEGDETAGNRLEGLASQNESEDVAANAGVPLRANIAAVENVENVNVAAAVNHNIEAPAPPAAAVAGPRPVHARNALDALRAHPRFQELRTRFQVNFASAHHLLHEIIEQHPQLRDEIDSNQAAFYNMMS